MFNYPEGATPIDQDEANGLKLKHITYQHELNEIEQSNINKAKLWLLKQPKDPKKLLDLAYLCKLHQQMFGDVWSWAGQFRKTEKNIGIDPKNISIEVKNLLDDVLYQLENRTYDLDEIVARFHHRLVKIHLFPNGNGRHARLVADRLLAISDRIPFNWGKDINLSIDSDTRKSYINALRDADKGNIEQLMKFVRS